MPSLAWAVGPWKSRFPTSRLPGKRFPEAPETVWAREIPRNEISEDFGAKRDLLGEHGCS